MARRLGSKDKQKRRRRIFATAGAIGATGLIGIGGAKVLKTAKKAGKALDDLKDANAVINRAKLVAKSSSERKGLIEDAATKLEKRAVNNISRKEVNRQRNTARVRANRELIKQDTQANSKSNLPKTQKEKAQEVKVSVTRMKSKGNYDVGQPYGERMDNYKGTGMGRKRKARFSSMRDIANFARTRGARDKKKRKSKVGLIAAGVVGTGVVGAALLAKKKGLLNVSKKTAGQTTKKAESVVQQVEKAASKAKGVQQYDKPLTIAGPQYDHPISPRRFGKSTPEDVRRRQEMLGVEGQKYRTEKQKYRLQKGETLDILKDPQYSNRSQKVRDTKRHMKARKEGLRKAKKDFFVKLDQLKQSGNYRTESSLAEFARRRGARDRKPRKKRLSSAAIKQNNEKFKEARRLISTANRTSQEIRGWGTFISRARRQARELGLNA